MRDVNRREALVRGAGFLAAVGGLTLAPHRALAATNDFDALLAEFTGVATPEAGTVTLDIAAIVENGAAAPMGLRVDSPMTAADHVAEVLVLADRNPNAGVARFVFSPMAGRAEVNTRIRLAESQTVVAVARMSDGRLFMDRRDVQVTIGGCGPA